MSLVRSAFLAIALIGLPAAPALAGDLHCFKSGARIDRPDQPPIAAGFRYNPFVVTTLGGMKGGLEKAAWDLQRDYPEQARAAQARLDAVEAHIATLGETRPSRYLQTRMIGHAPIYTDPYHQCDSGNFTVIEDEYVFTDMSDGAVVRVLGDLCAQPARLVWETAGTSGRLNLVALFESHLGRGGTLDSAFVSANEGAMARHPVEQLVLDLVAASQAQCGRAPDRIEMEVRHGPGNAVQTLQAHLNGDPVDSLKVAVIGQDDGYAMALSDAEAASRVVAMDQARRDRFLNWTAGADERFALGAAMVVGAMSMIGAVSPCFDDPTLFQC